MMEKVKGFDFEGMFFAANRLNRAHATSLLRGFERFGFCNFCLGANYTEHPKKKARWCCGAWDNGRLPLLKICERFRVDKNWCWMLLLRFAPLNQDIKSVHPPIKEISFTIGGIVIKCRLRKKRARHEPFFSYAIENYFSDSSCARTSLSK